MAVPSLLDLCIQAAANSVHWTVQRRSLERLPEHAANELLELLLLRQSPFLGGTTTAKAALLTGGVKEGRVVGRGGDRGSPAAAAGGGSTPLRPATLELFLHSVTRVRLWGPAVTLEWLAALSGFSHLETLTLTGCSKLTAAALQPLIFASGRPPASPTLTASPALTPAATSLRHLDISGCSRLGDEALPALASLSCLLSLNITETGVQGPGLGVLSSMRGLTSLQAGGLKAVGDEAWLSLLPHLPALRHLDLWGSDAGGGPDGGEQLLLLLAAGLPLLRYLGAAWTQLSTVPALPELEFLDLRHCWLREVWWPAGQPSPLALRQLLLRGAVLSGQLAAADDPPYSPAGLACVIRHSAATMEYLDLSEVGCADPWVAPLAALGTDGGGATASRLTHLDLSRTSVRAEDLAYLQCAPDLERLVAAGCRAAGSTPGAAALVAAGLQQLKDLNLSSCSVTDSAVSWLQQLTALTNLNLSDNTDLTLAPTTRTSEPTPGPARPQLQPPLQPPQPPALPDLAAPVDVWAAVPDARPGHGDGGYVEEPARAQLGPTRQGLAIAAAAAPQAMAAAADSGAAIGSTSSSNTRGCRDMERETGGCSSTTCSSSGTSGDGNNGDGGGVVWPRLRRLNLLGTRVGEAGFRALLMGDRGRGGGGNLGLLEQLKAGGPGLTDGTMAVLAAAELPSLHSLLLRDAQLTGHGLLLLSTGLPSLRRLELQACWLVSEQDAARLAASCRPGALVVVNGKAAAAASSRVTAARASPSSPPSASKGFGRGATASAAGSQQSRGAAGGCIGNAAALSGDYLSRFDQRIRYDSRMLLRLAASPLVTGGASSSEGEQGRGLTGGGSWEPLWADLPSGMRR